MLRFQWGILEFRIKFSMYLKLFRIAILLSFCGLLYSCVAEPIKKGTSSSQDSINTSNITNITNGNAQTIGQPSKKERAVNVFVENSGSMFGYIQTSGQFNPNTDFAATLSDYITRLILTNFVNHPDSLKLHYINSGVFRQNTKPSDFIKDLTARNAKTWGGNLGTTDMSSLFEKVMDNTQSNEVSIFVSDCIFSPAKGVNAANYLVSQKNAISFAVKSQSNKNLTFVCHRLTSMFDGKYYDCNNKMTKLKAPRPYFMWIIGNSQSVAELEKVLPISSLGGKNSCTIFKPSQNAVNYFVKKTIGNGANNGQRALQGVDLDSHAGKFTMTLYADFSKIPLGKYLTEVDHYELNNRNYKIEQIVNKPFGGATHQIRITTTMKPSPAIIEVKLKNELPNWVSDYSCDTDDPIANYMDKTFGIKQIVQGVFDAYYYGGKNELASMRVNIN